MANKRKKTTAIVAGVTAAALLLGGTFAWQSINQTALNEASDVINPGGRLHDDFDGSNKDVYVENFADEDIFARIQLSEYFAIIANYGKDGAETKTDIAGTATLDADGNIVDPEYVIHYFGEDANNLTDEYWNWTTGGSTVFMPTFNLNKDSLVADLNGNYVDAIGGISNRDDEQYTDYTKYAEGDTKVDTEIYDGDTNMADEVGNNFEAENLATNEDAGYIVTVPGQEHTAQNTLTTTGLISMADWLAMVETDGGYDAEAHGNYWVYDTDGWVYWSAPIAPDTATGLLLDGIELNGVMDDTWYYAINVVAQFVTADDVGKTDNTGFYATANGTVPTGDAETLLGLIGVEMNGEAGSDEPEVEDVFKIVVKQTADEDGYVDTSAADSSLYDGDSIELVLNNNDTAVAEGVTWAMKLIDGGQNTDNNTLEGTAIDADTGVLTVADGETTWQSNGYSVETYHIVEVTASVDGAEKASRRFVISGTGVYVSRLDFYEEGTNTLADEYALEVGKTYDLRGTLFNQSLYTDISRIITNNMEPIYVDGLTFTVTDGEGNSVTGAVVENGKFIATEAGTYNVFAEGTLENWGEVSLSNYSVTVVDASSSESGSTTQLTISIVETDYDGALTKGDTESITLKVDGNYSADDIEWTEQSTGVAFSYEMTTNDDGTITLSHRSTGICGANGQTFIATLKSDPSVTGSIFINCDC